MAVANLYKLPMTDRDMAIFSFSNADNHREILSGIAKQQSTGVTTLGLYVLDPIPISKSGWLLRHQAMHNDMNAALGLNGSDLSAVDFNNKEQLQSWIGLHAAEHYAASATLGIG